MGRFFGRLLAVLVGLSLFSAFMVVMVLGILGSSSVPKPLELEDPVVLKLDLNKPIYEKSYANPLSGLPVRNSKDEGYGLVELRRVIKDAASNEKIKAILLKINIAQTNYASLQEIRKDLEAFKKSGKKIYAYSEYYSEGAYYLSSVADKIYMPVSGYFEFNGLAYNVTFFKGTMDKLEIKPEIFKAGKYKSAVEPFLYDKMSDANREQASAFIESMYSVIIRDIGKSRNIEIDQLRNISDSMKVHNIKDALHYKLIDGIKYKDEVENLIQKELGLKKLAFVSYDKIEKSIDWSNKKDSKSQVAVIVAQGDIVLGKGSVNEIGSSTIIEQLKKVREDENIKAVVLRINSPGGSSLASDLMWREIEATKAVKPVVASMSDLAASGGYYMSMPCNYIFAQENTITGSIGVFGMAFNIKDFLNHKLGVTGDGVKTGKYSDLGQPTRELTDEERRFIQNEVDSTYKDFVAKAAEGRKKNFNDLEAVASGRVWTGNQALQFGLIDKIGGLEEAIAYAAKLAKIKDYSVSYVPETKGFLAGLMESFKEEEESEMEEKMKKQLGELYPYFVYLQKIKSREGVQARMLDLEVK